MKIEFEIEEKVSEIITEILHSGKWHSIVTDHGSRLKRIVIKNFMHDTVAFVEIWEHEIHIKTACCNSTYRIFSRNGSVICEYIGTCVCCKLLDRQVFLQLTPLKNIHHYMSNNESLEQSSEQDDTDNPVHRMQPFGRYDKFIHEYLPISLCSENR